MKELLKANSIQISLVRITVFLFVVLSGTLTSQRSHAISIAVCNSFAVFTIGFGKCYIPNAALDTWQGHENIAVSLGMGFHLTSIHSLPENIFIRNFADAAGLLRGVWIGLSDFANEGTFAWSDGTPFDYANWNPGEPNSGFSLVDEDGVMLADARVFPNAGWNDYSVNLSFGNPPQYAIYAALMDIPEPSPDPIPEPGTLVIFGLGLAGLGFIRRRRAA